MKKISLLFVGILIVFSCKNSKNESLPQESNSVSSRVFGDTISTEGAITVSDALNGLKNADSILCTITGYVTSVCQVKGCWMMLSEQASDTTGFFVKFKDYAFFVPKDLSGSKVTIKGKAYKEITPVEELKHYAEDEGKSKAEIDAITEPTEEYKFLAEGVMEEKKK